MSVRLTNLPVEVLQDIFLYLDPHSFYRVGLSCRRVRQLTLGSEFLLRLQVKSLPGPEPDLDYVPLQRLFAAWRRRTRYAMYGTAWRPDVTIYDLGRRHQLQPAGCAFVEGRPASLLLICHDEPLVRHYALLPEGPRLQRILTVEPPPAEARRRNFRLVKTAMNQRHVVAVLAAEECADEVDDTSDSEAIASPVVSHKLHVVAPFAGRHSATHPVAADEEGCVVTRRLNCKRPDVVIGSDRPLDMDISERDAVAISWDDSHIQVYEPKSAPAATGWGLSTVHLMAEPTRHLHFVGGGSFALARSDNSLIFDSAIMERPAGPAVSFQALENYQAETTYLGNNRQLRLGLAFPIEHQVRGNDCTQDFGALAVDAESKVLYLVFAQTYDDFPTCQHRLSHSNGAEERFGEGELPHWFVKLELYDIPPPPTGSPGNLLAMSPERGRLAISHWREIRVWPTYVSLMNTGDFTGEHWQFRSLPRVEPIKIRSDGVVHKLIFADEDRLYAVTDIGLILWRLGSIGTIKQKIERLHMEF